MDDTRFERLLTLYVDGKAAPAEITELESLLRKDPGLRRIFVDRLRVHVDLHALFESSTEEAAPAERPPTRRTQRRLPGRPESSSWTAGLIAAGALIGFVAILILSAGGSTSQERADAAQRRAVQARKDEARRKAELRLRDIERERDQILATPMTSEENPDPVKEEGRKKALQDLAERKLRIDEELKAATEREKPDVIVQKSPEESKPAPTPEGPQEKKTAVLAAPIARIGKTEGVVSLLVAGEKKPAVTGQEILPGQGIETAAGAVEILYPDQTRMDLGPGTLIREMRAEGGKRFLVEAGSVRAEVKPQPKGQPMILESATGEATVLGTTLKLIVDPDPAKGSRLEVEEGKVQFKNLLAGKTVMVETGHFAVAAAGTEFKPTMLPINEIVLVPTPDEKRMKRTGGEWRLIKDEQSPFGYALESITALRTVGDTLQSPSFVTMTFEAEANKDYIVWIRGECKGTGPDRGLQDGVILKFTRGQVTQRFLVAEWLPLGTDAAGLSGWGRYVGAGWVGGDGDWFNAKGERVPHNTPKARPGDDPPAIVRFTRPGTQTVRMYLSEGPMKIDAIWLSTTQKTRPDAGQFGPVKK